VVNATPRPLYPQQIRPRIHGITGWVSPRAGLDESGKSRLHRLSIPDHPACSKLLCRLSYYGHHVFIYGRTTLLPVTSTKSHICLYSLAILYTFTAVRHISSNALLHCGGSCSATGSHVSMTDNRCIQFKKIRIRLNLVVSCACELISLISFMFYPLTADHKFHYRLAINQIRNKWRLVASDKL
jgi:hypothetical protein